MGSPAVDTGARAPSTPTTVNIFYPVPCTSLLEVFAYYYLLSGPKPILGKLSLSVADALLSCSYCVVLLHDCTCAEILEQIN